MKNRQPHSIWLCPAKAAQEPLTTHIAKLSKISGVPAFEPHVTLLGDLNGAPEATVRACRRIALPPVKARVTGIGRTDAFFMALFLDLTLTPDLREIRAVLAQALGTQPKAFRPHLSLAYGPSPDLRSAACYAELDRAFVGMTFSLDQLSTVSSASNIPVENWHRIENLAL